MILFVVLVLNVSAMRSVQLKMAHAIKALTYVFVLILGKIFLKEKIICNKGLGIFLIMVGIIVFIM